MKFATLYLMPLVALSSACGESANSPADPQPTATGTATEVVEATPSGRFAPRNDCAGLAGAKEFLDQLAAATAARNVDALVALSDVHVRLGFGGEDGVANLRDALAENNGGLWDEIAELSSMGCAAQTGEFTTITMPWYFAQDMDGDPFETLIVTGEDVPVHEAADEKSPPLATVSWDAVQLLPEEGADGGPDDNGWRHVRLHAGMGTGTDPIEGYMRADRLRSVVDYRLLAHNGDGKWKISALLAGD